MDPTVVRVAGVPEPFNLPWMLALERRAFVRAGLEVQWRTVPQGTGAMCSLLREGAIDVAVMVTEGAILDILQGNPSRIIGTFVDSPLTWGVHVGAKSAAKTAQDLVGVPYAISRLNSGSHLMAMIHAGKLGWRPKPEELIVVDDLNGAAERMKGPEPMAFLWEKAITDSYVRQGTLRRVDELRPEWPAFVLVARADYLDKNERAVERLLRVLRDQAQGLQNKKNGPEMVAQRFGMDPVVAKEWFSTVRWNIDGKVDRTALQRVLDALETVGVLEPAPDRTVSMEKVLHPSVVA